MARNPPKNFRKKASKFIAEEVRTRKYPRKQAVAIGLSRARAAVKKESVRRTLEDMLKKYQ